VLGCVVMKSNYQRHGLTRTAEYFAWQHMKARCFNRNDKEYANYGGRGISVCRRWLNFPEFLADMGERPSPRHSLERKENNSSYSPENCVWALPIDQSNNKRTNHILTVGEKSLTVAQWARELGIQRRALDCRLRRLKAKGQPLTLAIY
jgi:hypothetical protein